MSKKKKNETWKSEKKSEELEWVKVKQASLSVSALPENLSYIETWRVQTREHKEKNN